MKFVVAAAAIAFALISAASAADYPAPRQGDWVATDFRFHTKPPETGITEAALKRIKNAKLHLNPPSTSTRGHSTTGSASFYAQPLRELLQTAPQRTM